MEQLISGFLQDQEESDANGNVELVSVNKKVTKKSDVKEDKARDMIIFSAEERERQQKLAKI